MDVRECMTNRYWPCSLNKFDVAFARNLAVVCSCLSLMVLSVMFIRFSNIVSLANCENGKFISTSNTEAKFEFLSFDSTTSFSPSITRERTS
jgi:hypothetical protein